MAAEGRALTVFAAVVTYNRCELLLECLDAIARQTHPVDQVVVVDNASTDGTAEALRSREVQHLRVERNGGGAEGFHYAVRAGLESGADWIWLMDDDCEPEPDALETLLASPKAADAAVLAPLVVMPGGAVLPLNRGWLRRRWFLTPLVGLRPADWEREATEVEHVSLVGPLVRREAAAATDPPRRELFIWWDDLEWVSRLREHGRVWLVPAARMVHKEPSPMPSTSFGARLRDYVSRSDFTTHGWKQAYGLRNMIFCGRRDGYLSAPRAAALAAVPVVRTLLTSPRAARLLASYARDGWRGRFRNVAPADWPHVATARDPDEAIAAHALHYDRDVA
jgi:GT2 family glycosyltransferase